MVHGLISISHQTCGCRYINDDYTAGTAFGPLSALSMVKCPTKYHKITNDSDTILLCDGMIHKILDPRTQFTDSKYRLSDFLRRNTSVIASIASFAVRINNDIMSTKAKRLFRSAYGLISRSGATPCEEPCCTLMEMTTAALVLTKAGQDK